MLIDLLFGMIRTLLGTGITPTMVVEILINLLFGMIRTLLRSVIEM